MKYPIRFGKYLLLERVNVGGMAEVFKSKTFGVEGFQRVLAIKRILPNMSEDEEFIHMFVDEARLAVQLNHANIVQIYELGKQENQYYIAMEYVAGKDLRRIIEFFRKRNQAMPVPLAAYICAKICEGLDYAHRKIDAMGNPINLVHRDVSPQNILVSFEGDVKVIDFGIAKAADRLSKTQAGVLKGKFGYMSPEQVSGLEIDRRSDLFAVGVLLYEMLTCTRLFVAETDFSTLEKVRQCEIPAMRERNAEIPDELELVVRKALTRDRDERYQWCSDFAEDLQRFLIVDQSIFNSKRMAQFMKETFKDDIDAENTRMQASLRIRPEDVAGSDEGDDRQQPPGGESTQIFEVGDNAMASAQTRVGDVDDVLETGSVNKNHSAARKSGTQRVEANLAATQAFDGGAVAQVKKQASQSNPDLDGGAHPRFSGPSEESEGEGQARDHTKWVLAAAVVVAVLILGGAIWWTQFRRAGDDLTWVRVETDPSLVMAELFVDRKPIAKGLTPFERFRIDAGKHELKVLAKDFADVVHTVEFVPGKTNVVSLKLAADMSKPASLPAALPSSIAAQSVAAPQPSPPVAALDNPQASLSVDSEPRGATVFLNGKRVGVTPKKIDGLDIGRTVNLELKRAGFRPYVEEINLRGDRAVEAKLVRESGGDTARPPRPPPEKRESTSAKGSGLLVVSTPGNPDTKVLVDGRDTKRVTPVPPGSPITLGAGNHTVTLVFKDGTKKSYPVQIGNGETFKLIERK